MDLTKILSISGRPGLYKMLTQTKTGIIVESFADQKRFPVFAHERMSTLEEISILTEGEDLPLKDVLKKIHDFLEGEKAPDASSDDRELWEFFEEAVPEFDRERVYKSDVKKVISWYNILHDHDMLSFEDEEETEEDAGDKSSSAEDAEDKPSPAKAPKSKPSSAEASESKPSSAKASESKPSSAKASEGKDK